MVGLVLGGTLVGRSAELETLDRLIEQSAWRGRAVVIEGEAGIGKTRLLQASVARAERLGFRVFSAAAEELESRRPFGIVADCLGLSGTAANPRRLEIASHLFGEGGPSGAENWFAAEAEAEFRAIEEVLALIDHLSASGPVALALDDLQWADPSSLIVLNRLVRRLQRMPVLVVGTARPIPRRPELATLLGALPARIAWRLRLGPLGAEAWPALVESLLGAEPGPVLLRQVAGAAGNPLFVTELVRTLAAAGAIEIGADGRAETGAMSLPSALPAAILHRLSFLAPDTLRLLGLASVLGSSFSVVELSLLAGRRTAALVPALSEGLRAGVLDEQEDRIAFRHQLIREALYDDLPLGVRKSLHNDLWRSLADAGAPAVRVAEHVARGASPGDGEAGTAFLRSGDADGARPLLEEARGLYERLQATRDLRRLRVHLRAAGVRPGRRGRRRRPTHGWAALTETELVVVRLVAERLSNPEIAQRLFLSRRTVQTHVSHALAKLDVRSRLELGAEAGRHGWRLRLEQSVDTR